MEAPAPGAVQIQKHSRFEPTEEKKRPFSVELDECYERDTLSHLLSFSCFLDTVALLDNPTENELGLGLGLEFVC